MKTNRLAAISAIALALALVGNAVTAAGCAGKAPIEVVGDVGVKLTDQVLNIQTQLIELEKQGGIPTDNAAKGIAVTRKIGVAAQEVSVALTILDANAQDAEAKGRLRTALNTVTELAPQVLTYVAKEEDRQKFAAMISLVTQTVLIIVEARL
jgi:hypothetical protein